jgi:hypothetical protein
LGGIEGVEEELGDCFQATDGIWFDPLGGRVKLLVASELAAESVVGVAVFIDSGVRGPHPFVRLAHTSEVVRNCASSNGFATGCEASIAESFGKNLEVRYKVDSGVVGVQIVRGTELHPQSPMFVGGAGSLRHSAGSHLLADKAVISAELMSGDR